MFDPKTPDVNNDIIHKDVYQSLNRLGYNTKRNSKHVKVSNTVISSLGMIFLFKDFFTVIMSITICKTISSKVVKFSTFEDLRC